VGYLAPRTFGWVLNETLSDEPRAVEARRRIPVLGKYLVRKPSDVESGHARRTIVISGNPLEEAAASNVTSNVEVASGLVTPVPVHRERESRFSDGTQASYGG
jgi:hypothetical protein